MFSYFFPISSTSSTRRPSRGSTTDHFRARAPSPVPCKLDIKECRSDVRSPVLSHPILQPRILQRFHFCSLTNDASQRFVSVRCHPPDCSSNIDMDCSLERHAVPFYVLRQGEAARLLHRSPFSCSLLEAPNPDFILGLVVGLVGPGGARIDGTQGSWPEV